MKCRACDAVLSDVFIDLGQQPLSNELRDDTDKPQAWYPLKAYRCGNCDLVQTACEISPESIFNEDYPYYSSTNETSHWEKYASWVMHYYNPEHVLEIASNDGYLLKHFPDHVKTVGYEPALNVALKSVEQGIDTVHAFFDEESAPEGYADIVIGNNVLAHTPDPVSMLKGARKALKPGGYAIFEFPHVYKLVKTLAWDTIYHEHYSYLSLKAVVNMAKQAGLVYVHHVEQAIHGGSLRVVLSADPMKEKKVYLEEDYCAAIFKADVYIMKRNIQQRVIDMKRNGLKIAGYGAAAKAATLLNYCGIWDSIDYIVDETPAKQGKYLSGTSIPIVPPKVLLDNPPDVLWVFPWNFKDYIVKKLGAVYDGDIMTIHEG